jgi:hypothetical protein
MCDKEYVKECLVCGKECIESYNECSECEITVDFVYCGECIIKYALLCDYCDRDQACGLRGCKF